MSDADAPDGPRKPDLRFTKREDQGVSIDRDLSGQGHLARGDKTRMSNLRFSVQAKSRDYLDPELAALHETPPARVSRERTVHVEAPPPAPVVEPTPVPVAPVAPPSMMGRIADVFRRFVSGR